MPKRNNERERRPQLTGKFCSLGCGKELTDAELIVSNTCTPCLLRIIRKRKDGNKIPIIDIDDIIN